MPVEFVKPKINPALILKEDVKLLKEAKKYLHDSADSAASIPGRQIYICYAVQAAAEVKQPEVQPPFAEVCYIKANYPQVWRLNRMIQVAIIKNCDPEAVEAGIPEEEVVSFDGITEHHKYSNRELCEARHAWLDYMIETCEEYFK